MNGREISIRQEINKESLEKNLIQFSMYRQLLSKYKLLGLFPLVLYVQFERVINHMHMLNPLEKGLEAFDGVLIDFLAYLKTYCP